MMRQIELVVLYLVAVTGAVVLQLASSLDISSLNTTYPLIVSPNTTPVLGIWPVPPFNLPVNEGLVVQVLSLRTASKPPTTVAALDDLAEIISSIEDFSPYDQLPDTFQFTNALVMGLLYSPIPGAKPILLRGQFVLCLREVLAQMQLNGVLEIEDAKVLLGGTAVGEFRLCFCGDETKGLRPKVGCRCSIQSAMASKV